MDLQLLDETLAARSEPAFRARQVWEWAARGAGGYAEMTNLPVELREQLQREVPFSSLDLRGEAHAGDGTVKALFATADGRPLEAVLMRYRNSPAGTGGRRSICVSSQSGCPLTCTFCATGSMKFGRNLSVSEIVDQALHFRRMEGVDNCVFMGMGEPMLNLDNVLAACERLPDLGIAHRRTAISTVGWVPGIERLAECEMPVRLALSLHAAEDALRSELMPVNERYPLAEVIEACRAFYARKRRRVFVEYVMLAGVNDRYEQALALARVLATSRDGKQVFKVNLIPYNPTESRYRGSSRESIAAFRDVLLERGVEATVRLTRGRDIDAACGQLAARSDITPIAS
jgi:23S rRNA (adenine2503-C2)-methyltransferase